ncbi:MAG: hypothetical protein MZV65_31185 [Chromatiales bacterium]|nr:hypothetical protein [Chromatiales bacterium]
MGGRSPRRASPSWAARATSPPFFQKMNKNGVASHILLVQGLIVTFLAIMFVILPSVQAGLPDPEPAHGHAVL